MACERPGPPPAPGPAARASLQVGAGWAGLSWAGAAGAGDAVTRRGPARPTPLPPRHLPPPPGALRGAGAAGSGRGTGPRLDRLAGPVGAPASPGTGRCSGAGEGAACPALGRWASRGTRGSHLAAARNDAASRGPGAGARRSRRWLTAAWRRVARLRGHPPGPLRAPCAGTGEGEAPGYLPRSLFGRPQHQEQNSPFCGGLQYGGESCRRHANGTSPLLWSRASG